MKKTLLLSVLFGFFLAVSGQPRDFILLKKKNNRTLKTYFPGSFLAAYTQSGFYITGRILDIRNDSVIVQQEETRLTATEFGSALDTLRFTIAVDYRELVRFNYSHQYVGGKKRGFVSVTLPRLMIIGGTGYLVLELVNTAYRGESLSQNNKPLSLAIAGGVAATGFIWQKIHNHSQVTGGKYVVVYVRNQGQSK